MKKISFLILGGGRGSRMGYLDKSQLIYRDNLTFLEKILSELPDDSEILFSTNSSSYCHDNNNYNFQDKKFKIIKDIFPECGPISGLHSALKNMKGDYLMVITCDTPNITKDFIDYISQFIPLSLDLNLDIITVKDNHGRIHPLCCSIYSKNMLHDIEKNIQKKDFKIMNLLENSNVKILNSFPVDFDLDNLLLNINTPEDMLLLPV